MTKKLTHITDEQRGALKKHADLWIGRAFRTEPINPEAIIPAIKALYAAADLKEPTVVVVSSPLVATLSGTFAAAALHWLREDAGIGDTPTAEVIKAAATQACRQVADSHTDLVLQAVELATRHAVNVEVPNKVDTLAPFMVSCLKNWSSMYQGGNLWSPWVAYLSSYYRVLGLDLPEFEKFRPYEECAIEGGFRMLHEDFCIVSDFPEVIRIDEDNLPHCDDGPSHRWRDGWSIWSIHGVQVDEQIVMRPETQTIQQIESEDNQEVKRVRIERFGWGRYLRESGAKQLHQLHNDRDNQEEILYELKDGQKRFVCIDPSTGRKYALGVPRDINTCTEAQHWMSSGLDRYAIHRS